MVGLVVLAVVVVEEEKDSKTNTCTTFEGEHRRGELGQR